MDALVFPDLPLAGMLGPSELAEISGQQASPEGGLEGLFGFEVKPWQHTEHQLGYIDSGDQAELPVLGVSGIQPDPSLRGARVDVRLDRLHVHSYPGLGSAHEVLVTFTARNEVGGMQEDLSFSQAFDVQEGQGAGVRGYPIFRGLSVGEAGMAFSFATINVRSQDDEALLAVLKSDTVKAGLGLLEAAQPAIKPLTGIALGVAKAVARRSRNVKVQDFYLGLDFAPKGTGIGLRTGSFVAVQVPAPGTIDWSEWRWHRDKECFLHQGDGSTLPYNYLLFRVGRSG